MTAEEYLSVLNPEQKQAVIHEGHPLLILAGAGSGKTRVITTKIAYLISEKGYAPSSILAVTFTKKAANEMAERACKIEPRAFKTPIRTFHSFGAWFLRTYAGDAGIDSNFTVYDDDDMVTLLTKAVPALSHKEAAIAAHKISLAKDYCLTPDSKKLSLIEQNESFPNIYSAYQNRLRETGNVDFGDLIMLPFQILESSPLIKSYIHQRFHVIMVDEYQDSNAAQFMLLQQLTGDNTYICVVGDDDQSIYRFRGAEVKNILTFQDHFPGTEIIRLERNYRSFSPILAAAGSIVNKNKGRLGKTLKAERGNGKKPTVVFLPTQYDESAFCAELVSQSHEKGAHYSDWAILYRTNAQSLSFETEFLHRKIPYVVVGSLKFYEREEIKDALAFLALIANPKDEIAFRRIINKPSRGIGNVTQDKIIALSKDGYSTQLDDSTEKQHNIIEKARQFAETASKKTKAGLLEFISIFDSLVSFIDSPGNSSTIKPKISSESTKKIITAGSDSSRLSYFIEKIATLSGLVDYHSAQDEITGTQRVANLQELVNSASLYAADRTGLIEFLDHIELDRSLVEENSAEKDAVTLITLHNTKGLEFSRVIITGLEAGIFPRLDKSRDDIEEERRLFYVGMTRARDELYITSCNIRRLYGRTEHMDISPFLLDLDRNCIEVLGRAPSAFTRFSHGISNKSSDFGSDNTIWSTTEITELAEKWHKGQKLFQDDYGIGVITAISETDGEFVITVHFENGETKRFMPKYQAHKLDKLSD